MIHAAGTGLPGARARIARAGALVLAILLVVACSSSNDGGAAPTNVAIDGGGGGGDAATPDGSPEPAPPVFASSQVMQQAFDFVKTKMRNPDHSVRTNLVDVPTTDDLYLLGWNATAEHQGLMLWVSAAMGDRAAFDETYEFVSQKLVSPRWGVVAYAYVTSAQKPFESPDENGLMWRVNAPLDDMRVARGLIAGWTVWHDPKYKALALKIGRGLIETSISSPTDFPRYMGGLVTPGCFYREDRNDISTTTYKIPVNYADLWTMAWFAVADSRWHRVIDASVQMMQDAQIKDRPGGNGQFHNVLLQDTMTFDGGWEYRDPPMGQKILAIQSLWTAIHLARAGKTAPAQAALDFYKKFYAANGRIPHFLDKEGTIPTEPEFSEEPVPADASAELQAKWGSFGGAIQQGEARVYAQVARLAYLLGDREFGDKMITEKILPDQVTDPALPTFGYIGKRTSGDQDADGYNVLEALLALAFQENATALVSQALP